MRWHFLRARLEVAPCVPYPLYDTFHAPVTECVSANIGIRYRVGKLPEIQTNLRHRVALAATLFQHRSHVLRHTPSENCSMFKQTQLTNSPNQFVVTTIHHLAISSHLQIFVHSSSTSNTSLSKTVLWPMAIVSSIGREYSPLI